MKPIIPLLLTTLTISCGGDNTIQTNMPGAKEQTVLEGLWKSSCLKIAEEGEEVSNRTIYKLRVIEDTYSYETWEYKDSHCEKEPISKGAISGSITLTGPSETLPGITNLEATVDKVTLQIFDETMIPGLNLNKTCGFQDWKAGITKELIETKECSDYKKGQISYQIFHLNPDRSLYMGKSTEQENATSRESRPKALNKAIRYKNWENRIP